MHDLSFLPYLLKVLEFEFYGPVSAVKVMLLIYSGFSWGGLVL